MSINLELDSNKVAYIHQLSETGKNRQSLYMLNSATNAKATNISSYLQVKQ